MAPFNMSVMRSSLMHILATDSTDHPGIFETTLAHCLNVWLVAFIIMTLPKARSGLGRLIRTGMLARASWPSMTFYVLPVMMAAFVTVTGAHVCCKLLIFAACSATDRLFASVYGLECINAWQPLMFVLRLLLIPIGYVSGHLEYVPPGDDGDGVRRRPPERTVRCLSRGRQAWADAWTSV